MLHTYISLILHNTIAILTIINPILFGPGLIATIIVLNSNISHKFTLLTSYSVISVSILFSSIIVYLTLSYATSINKILGITGAEQYFGKIEKVWHFILIIGND